MKTTFHFPRLFVALAAWCALALAGVAQEPSPTPVEPVEKEAPLRRLDNQPEQPAKSGAAPERRSRMNNGSDNIPVGDHYVPAHTRTREAISIFGSTTVDGEATSDAVSIFGNTTIGPDATVGGAAVAIFGSLKIDGPVDDNAVAVLGTSRINARVRSGAVAVLGNLELGPKAIIEGDAIVVGGVLKKDPAAVIHGNVVRVPFIGDFGDMEWLATWLRRCAILGRLLAFGGHLGWAWGVAFSFLAFYVVLALLFSRGIERCAALFETRPGPSIWTSFLTVFLTPIVLVLLVSTIIGAIAVPFVGFALLIAGLFGKAVMLAWVGRRFTRFFGDGPLGHPAFAVLVGGLLVMLLYTVPLVGLFTYKLLGWLGLGVVVYAIAQSLKREKPVTMPAAPGAPLGGAPVPGAAAPSAFPVSAPSVVPAAVEPAPSKIAPSPVQATVEPPQQEVIRGSVASLGASSAGFGQPSVPPPPIPTVPPSPAYVPPPLLSSATLPRAGFMIRMAALFLDLVLVGILCAMLNNFLPRMHHFNPPQVLIPLAIYGAVMWKLRGTTIGGIVCGLKVVRVDNRVIDWPTAVVRALSCFLSMAVAGLGFLWMLFDDDRQTWHDKIAGTTVVRVPKGMSLV